MVFIPYPPGEEAPDFAVNVASEIEMNRSLTRLFIEMDPTDIVLIPRSTVRTPTGGTRTIDDDPRDLQRVKLIYGGNTGAGRAGIVDTGDGRERQFSYVMVMNWDAQVQPGDHFTDPADQQWEVEEVLPLNGYEVKALLRSYGKNPQYG
jgi:hypothetical protein